MSVSVPSSARVRLCEVQLNMSVQHTPFFTSLQQCEGKKSGQWAKSHAGVRNFAAQQTLQTPSFSLESKIKGFYTRDNHLTQMRFAYLQKYQMKLLQFGQNAKL